MKKLPEKVFVVWMEDTQDEKYLAVNTDIEMLVEQGSRGTRIGVCIS